MNTETIINNGEERTVPIAGTVWGHPNGKLYTVLHIANKNCVKANFPLLVVYLQGSNIYAVSPEHFLAKRVPVVFSFLED